MDYKKILLIALLSVLLGAFSFFVTNYWLEREIENYFSNLGINQLVLKEAIEERVTYVIDKGASI